MLISMEHGSSKSRRQELQLISPPVEHSKVNGSHVDLSIQSIHKCFTMPDSEEVCFIVVGVILLGGSETF